MSLLALFRSVQTIFWDDPKVLEELTPEDKYFYLYLITNPNASQIGIYQITKKQMGFHTGYSIETINQLMDRFENNHKIIKYNPETRELAIKNWAKYNFPRLGKPIEDCVKKEISLVKDKTLIEFVAENIEKNEKLFKLYTSRIPSHNTSREEKEKEKEQEKEYKKEQEQQQEKDEVTVTKENEPVVDDVNKDDAIIFYENNFGVLNPYITEDILYWCKDCDESLVIESMKRALAQNKQWAYAVKILVSWKRRNIKSMDDVYADDIAFKKRKEQLKDESKRSDQPDIEYIGL